MKAPAGVLSALRGLGVEVVLRGAAVVMRGAVRGLPPDLLASARSCKAGLAALLAAEAIRPPEPSAEEAAAALSRVEADLGVARLIHAASPARLAVLAAVEEVFRRHGARGDPLLVEDAPLVSELMERWAEDDRVGALSWRERWPHLAGACAPRRRKHGARRAAGGRPG